MVKILAFTVAIGSVVAVSAAIPTGFIADAGSLREPGLMLLLASALFAIASAMRRHGKSPRR